MLSIASPNTPPIEALPPLFSPLRPRRGRRSDVDEALASGEARKRVDRASVGGGSRLRKKGMSFFPSPLNSDSEERTFLRARHCRCSVTSFLEKLILSPRERTSSVVSREENHAPAAERGGWSRSKSRFEGATPSSSRAFAAASSEEKPWQSQQQQRQASPRQEQARSWSSAWRQALFRHEGREGEREGGKRETERDRASEGKSEAEKKGRSLRKKEASRESGHRHSLAPDPP